MMEKQTFYCLDAIFYFLYIYLIVTKILLYEQIQNPVYFH